MGSPVVWALHQRLGTVIVYWCRKRSPFTYLALPPDGSRVSRTPATPTPRRSIAEGSASSSSARARKNNGRKRSRALINRQVLRSSKSLPAAVGHWAAGRKGCCCGRPSTGDDENTIAPAGQDGIFPSGPILKLRILNLACSRRW